MLESILKQAQSATAELLALAKLPPRSLLVVGCSTSEVAGEKIGSAFNQEIAAALWEGIFPILQQNGIWLAAQCCEHLNRALILEREAADAYHIPVVNVLPQPKAGGSFATAAYRGLSHPCAVESIQAHAGMDIGDTLIGMHLRPVAVPVRLSVRQIGQANLVCARTRPKFIGGERACYDPQLK